MYTQGLLRFKLNTASRSSSAYDMLGRSGLQLKLRIFSIFATAHRDTPMRRALAAAMSWQGEGEVSCSGGVRLDS
jgi:hypothetical protein